MAIFIKHVAAKNYRALADLTLDLGEVDVLFGPNGAGKSTLLDVLWFIRDCAVRGAAEASAARSHGIGMLFDGVDEDEPLEVSIETDHVTYALKLSLSSGRLEAFPGERLRSLHDDVTFIDRSPGSTRASFFHAKLQEPVFVPLREPEKLSLTRYLDFDEDAAHIAELDRRLRFIRFYPARTANFRAIKRFGSERGYESWVFGDGTNLWSVLSNIHNKMAVDNRYATIMGFMRESFPSFEDLVFETTGATSVYGSFVERRRRKPILASGVSDGHLQMLFLLTALFGEGPTRTSILLFDEPETSLHPWALSVLAEAVKAAVSEHAKQVLIATHSPVLMSQFEPKDCLAVQVVEGRTELQRVSEIEGIKDLLDQYAMGSLYMAEAIAPQRASEDRNDV